MEARGLWAFALLLLLSSAGDVLAASTPPERVAGVSVYRGPGSGPLPKLETETPQRQALTGERLWLVDEEAGTVVSCRNIGTANVGQRRVRCTRGRLPSN